MDRARLLVGVAGSAALVAALASPVHASPGTAAAPARPAAPAPSTDPAARIQKDLRMKLGSRFGGAWVPENAKGKVVVATTDASAAGTIRAAGAQPKVVRHSERALGSVQSTLNAHARSAAKTVNAWYVDNETNTVVVQARSVAAAKRFVAASGVDAGAVRIVKTTAKPRPLYDIVGGERYWTTQYGCSVAFSVTNGFITAGHCGDTGETTSGSNQVSQGTFGGSSFPGNDYAWVNTNSQWTPTPKVNRWNGTYESVQGATEAPVGTPVCRSGGTTNSRLWCATIAQRNATVQYQEGTVTGLIRTAICADPGDSGGALITQSGGQAQGITSGGSGSCNNGQGSGDETYFQPVGEVLQILAQQGREIVTEGGNPPGGACDQYQTKVSASLTSGGNQYQPNGNYTTTASGAHRACLDGPAGVDFDLYLQKQNGGAWTTVAQSTSPDPDESINYNGTPGTYRYRVHAYSGSGEYTLGFDRP
ncbi:MULTISPECIES: S1 family peptidase [Actinomadura]|uniref:S1 family peptidase n=1 Tax=Actinomadura yumaensis TaxID=111807 RepID=A0ABW2CDZ9_9ACTN|nr:S1 family peptidase [Actinomadura sp. J1-007]MWK33567.1 S1 family peptidase [Actinomadura sp. J1-007]